MDVDVVVSVVAEEGLGKAQSVVECQGRVESRGPSRRLVVEECVLDSWGLSSGFQRLLILQNLTLLSAVIQRPRCQIVRISIMKAELFAWKTAQPKGRIAFLGVESVSHWCNLRQVLTQLRKLVDTSHTVHIKGIAYL